MDKDSENRMSFRVTGMTCTTCAKIVERAMMKVPGVEFAAVNLATESVFVSAENSVTFEMLEAAVKKSGYAILKDIPDDLDERRYREARRDLVFILATGLPMSCLMFAHMFFGVHFSWYNALEVVVGGAAIFYGGRRTLSGAWIALVHGHTNMDTLITISASASWLTAVMVLFGADIPSFGTVGVMILMLHLTGRYIESRLRDRAAKRIKSLLTLQPREARVIKADGSPVMVPVEAVKPGTIISVVAGERIPLDGVVRDGVSSVDESMLTGESMPVVKDAGSDVTGGGMNLSGVLTIETTKAGEDTFLAKMLELVREAQGGKVPLQALADRITLRFVPGVISLALISAFAWYSFYDSLFAVMAPIGAHLPWPTSFASPASAAIYAFVATLVIACPCALGLATPLALVVSAGEASRSGLLIRNAEAIQTLHGVNKAILDKTGTITKGTPRVTEAALDEGAAARVLAIESMSSHPLATAITAYLDGTRREEKPDTITEVPGEGVYGRWGPDEWFVGKVGEASRLKPSASRATVVEVRRNDSPAGYFCIMDQIREDSRSAVAELRSLGIEPIMATGDGMDAAISIATDAGIDDVRWEIRPEGKLSLVRSAQSKGCRVIMAGDGINDAAALKGADVGIAMGGGMDLAVDSADIVILKGGLSKVVAAVKIAYKTRAVIRQNLFGAFFYNIIAIPLAMSGLLHPLVAEAAMAASSITVILNSLRIAGSANSAN